MKLDKHYTPDDVAAALALSVVERYDPGRTRTYMEPSVGAGAFLRGLLAAGIPRSHILTVDLDPSVGPDLVRDFLTLDVGYEVSIVIGNPPFGNGGSLASRFVAQGLVLAPVVCYVMPLAAYRSGWMTARNIAGVEFTGTKARCIWLEYARGVSCFAPEIPKQPEIAFDFVGPGDEYDLVIQRCGGSVGRVTTCNGTGQGKYYVKLRKPNMALLRAFHGLERFLPYAPNTLLTTHQLSLDRNDLRTLVTLSFFSENFDDQENV